MVKTWKFGTRGFFFFFFGFFWQFCDVVTLVYAFHPQEELAKFGYRPERKVEKFMNRAIYFGDLFWNLLSKFNNFIKKNPFFGRQLWYFFFLLQKSFV
jgi:hypothetical protein